MEFILNKNYKIIVKTLGRETFMRVKVIDIDGNHITFEDKYGEIVSFHKDIILSSKEVDNGK